MIDPVPGSSLLQAQDDDDNNSNSNSKGRLPFASHSYRFQHNHNHARSHHDRLHRRQDQSSDTIVQVVQTVSVYQLVDESGAVVATSTAATDPTTTEFGNVGVLSAAAATTTTTDDASNTPSTALTTTASSIDDSSTLSMTSSFPTVETFASITPAPSSGSSAFPTFAGVTNSTQGASTALSKNGTATFPTLVAHNLTTSTLASSAGTILYNDTFTTTLSTSSFTLTLTSSSDKSASTSNSASSSTGSEDGGSTTVFASAGGNSATGAGSSPSSTSTSSTDAGASSNSTSSTTPAATVAGSVLGAVAGVAFLLVIALMLLRYKKRQRGLRLSDNGGAPGTRGLLVGGALPPSAPGPRGMTEAGERRSVPFAVPAALASLTSYKRFSQRGGAAPPDTGERGFQKVSGRKLPSVLQHGGDGYTDPTESTNPRDTMMTDRSFYRNSEGFFGGPGTPRFAVGSPMRPESGIPVFHAGPARTPISEQGHFSDSPFLDPPPSRDPLGRSHASQDGSRGSGSRFTEEI